MKKLFFTFLFLTFTLGVFAQQDNIRCALEDAPNYQTMYNNVIVNHSGSIDPAVYQNAEPLVLNVFVWGINRFDSSNVYHLNEEKALATVAYLNINYNHLNIFFKYRGWQEFDTPILDPQNNPNGFYIFDNPGEFYSDFIPWVENSPYYYDNMINIYANGWNTGFGAAAQGTGTNIYTSPLSKIATGLSAHEMAHCLGLWHTRSNNEHVTRDPNDPNFNALTAGDRILDTAAQREFYPHYSGCPTSDPSCYQCIDSTNCEYINCEEYDNSNPPQNYYPHISHLDVINLMADAYLCSTEYLTPGQAVYMRETILQDPDVNVALTTVSSLFEPYKGEYYLAGPFDPTIHTPLFQPGFNYRFMECDGNYPQPADYNDISYPVMENVLLGIQENETNYANIKHPNHSAIWIQEIAQYDTDANQLDYPRKCYDNTNKAAESGLVTKFNDGVLNTNVTVMPQDSTSINSPQLIQNLQPGLYKIDKVYENGATEQTIILKENN